MKQPVRILSEGKFDSEIHSGAFFKIYDREQGIPAGLFDRKVQLNDKLIARAGVLFKKDSFFVNDDVWPNESLICDLNISNLKEQAIQELVNFLQDNAPTNAIYGGVYSGDISGPNYIGRYVVTIKGLVAVEKSLTQFLANRRGP
jgi:hypothetical protein